MNAVTHLIIQFLLNTSVKYNTRPSRPTDVYICKTRAFDFLLTIN